MRMTSRGGVSLNSLFKYKSSDWESIQMKLWNSYQFKDFGVQRLAEYREQIIPLPKLKSLLEYILQIQFTQREVVALVSELRCTTTLLGETVIQYPQLLTELKLLGLSLTHSLPPPSIAFITLFFLSTSFS